MVALRVDMQFLKERFQFKLKGYIDFLFYHSGTIIQAISQAGIVGLYNRPHNRGEALGNLSQPAEIDDLYVVGGGVCYRLVFQVFNQPG